MPSSSGVSVLSKLLCLWQISRDREDGTYTGNYLAIELIEAELQGVIVSMYLPRRDYSTDTKIKNVQI